MGGIVVSYDCCTEVQVPRFVIISEASEERWNSAINPLHCAIASWRIRSGKFVLDIETVKEGTNYVRCEFRAIIGEKSRRYARDKRENLMLKSTNDG